MHSRNGRQRRCINRIHHPVNALQIIANSLDSLITIHLLRNPKQFFQVRSRRESAFQRAINNKSMRFTFYFLQGGSESFQFFECEQADLIARLTMQRQLHNAVGQSPGKSLSFKFLHNGS